VQGRLRAAAANKETFYGLLAASALGIRAPTFEGLHNYRDAEWRPIAGRANVKAAIALAELGEADLADLFIRHQARIGSAADHNALLHLAADLNLPATQFYLAHNAPRGASVNMAARYPRPDWQPARGWRVDQALVFAHALQESGFRTSVVSPAGATGLLQVRPGTAGDIARARGEPFSPALLTLPAANMEFGQTFIEGLRDSAATGGLLLKVIAASTRAIPCSTSNRCLIGRRAATSPASCAITGSTSRRPERMPAAARPSSKASGPASRECRVPRRCGWSRTRNSLRPANLPPKLRLGGGPPKGVEG
jgi:soluble lytic murein transglycosylase-like protein